MNKLIKVLGLAGILLAGSSWGMDFDSILCLKGGSYISASAAGDVNGDSLDDLITNIPNGTGTGYQGSGSIYFGPLNDSIANKVLLSSPGSRYVFSAGDVNKDGYSDVMVKGGDNAVRIYFGSANMDTLPDIIFNDSSIKTYPQGIGDFNKDGYDDIAIPFVVGSTYYTGIYFGGTSMDTTRDVTLRGMLTISDCYLSGKHPIEENGDINGDGYYDVITLIPDTVNNHDTLLVYYGNSTPDDTIDISLVVDNISSVSIRANVNGDGYSDILIGSEHANNSKGNVYVLFGGNPLNTDIDTTFEGESPDTLFGALVRTAGDINGDGFDDILVYERSKDYVFLGDTSMSTQWVWQHVRTYEGILGTAGDIDNDGRSEFFTGKYQRSGPTAPPYLEVWHCNVGVEEKGLSAPKNKLSVSSNPFTESIELRVESKELKDNKIQIYDVTGKLVKEISINNNTGTVTWDGKDDNGKNLPDGSYFCRLNAGVNTSEVKITKITSTGGAK